MALSKERDGPTDVPLQRSWRREGIAQLRGGHDTRPFPRASPAPALLAQSVATIAGTLKKRNRGAAPDQIDPESIARGAALR